MVFSKWKSLITLPCTVILTLIILFGCKPKTVSVEKTDFGLGTYVQINIVVPKTETKKAEKTLESLFGLLSKYEKIFDYRPSNGNLHKFNKSTTLERKGSEQLFDLIVESIRIANITEGYFDPTLLPLTELWGFETESPHLPDPEEIRKILKNTGYQKLKITNHIINKPENIRIDLSGIAKGKIVDILRDKLFEEGFKNFLINAGGDMYVAGHNKNGQKWRIAIQDPDSKNKFAGILEKSNIAIVTSGNYERYFIKDGKRYTHLFNPKTGYPDSDIKSVTVLTEDTAFGDAIATAVFVMGSKKGYDFLKTNDIEGLIIYDEGGERKSLYTEGFWK